MATKALLTADGIMIQAFNPPKLMRFGPKGEYLGEDRTAATDLFEFVTLEDGKIYAFLEETPQWNDIPRPIITRSPTRSASSRSTSRRSASRSNSPIVGISAGATAGSRPVSISPARPRDDLRRPRHRLPDRRLQCQDEQGRENDHAEIRQGQETSRAVRTTAGL